MTPRRLTAFRIDDDLLAGLREVEVRDGVLISEQVRRAIADWLQKKGVKAKTDRRRARTPRRS